MAKVILICGKIASGKTFYCKRLLESCPAVRLSVDELTARIGKLGELHDTVSAAAQSYLLERAADIVRAGADALLDWGFWSQSSRKEASRFFRSRPFPQSGTISMCQKPAGGRISKSGTLPFWQGRPLTTMWTRACSKSCWTPLRSRSGRRWTCGLSWAEPVSGRSLPAGS
ncbi:MAG: ATP-binding protein [Acutalibacter sp.]|jgi:hypothetical protein|nr:ATP-binding protein [Acutalibacter sp.]